MTSKIIVNNIGSDTGINTVTFDSNVERGTSNLHSVGVEVAGINVLGADTPIGTGATIYDDGGARFSGVVTATSFSGSVAASQLTGALPAISGANLTGITGTTINNNGSNRIITGSGTANTLEGEATFTYDGVNKAKIDTNQTYAMFQLDGNAGGAIEFYENGTRRFELYGIDAEVALYDRDKGAYHTRFKSGGDVEVSDGNLKISTSGHGIDFSAASGSNAGASHSILDDYEDGSYTANFEVTSGSVNFSQNTLHYTKIGNICYVNGEIATNATGYNSPGGHLRFDLPFTSSNAAGYAGYARGIVGAIWAYYAPSNPHGNYGWYPLHAHIGNNQSTDVILYIVGFNGTNSNWGPIGNLVGNSAQIPISFTYRTA